MNINGFIPIPNHVSDILRSDGFRRMADQAVRFVEIDRNQKMEDAKLRAELSLYSRVR